jgi:nucleoside-diphosphate-sugar epimerase
MKKIAITGHLGFIGSHLYQKLKDDYRIIGIDLKNGKDIRKITKKDLKGVEYIFHLAAQPRVPLSIEKPEMTHDHNVNGTLNILIQARDAGVKRVIYSASSSVYGKQDNLPLKEGMSPNPLSPYAVQKLTGEYYCKVFSDLYKLETVCLRYFNVYGEGMSLKESYPMCIAKFLDQKKRNIPLTIYGGEQSRDFVFVGDVVEANILAMKKDSVGNGEVINIGSGKSYTIQEIANVISSHQEISEFKRGEAMATLADISKAKKLLRYSPKMNLMDWLKSQL